MRRRIAAAGAAALLAAAALLGCSSKPPVIQRTLGRVIYTLDAATGERAETLGVYVVGSDPDGEEDLDALYLIHDEAELFWKVDAASWSSAVAEGESWIGTSSFVMPDGGAFPAGNYRVVLQSADGETAEDSFTLPARPVALSAAVFPKAVVDGGTIRVSNAPAGCEVWAYAADGALAAVYALAADAPTLTVATVTASAPALAAGFTFRVATWNEAAAYGTLSGPWAAGK